MKFHRDTVFRLSPLALALALPGLALAHGDDATDLDKVVVTATRTASTADAALAAVEVIDRAQIDASSARSLPEFVLPGPLAVAERMWVLFTDLEFLSHTVASTGSNADCAVRPETLPNVQKIGAEHGSYVSPISSRSGRAASQASVRSRALGAFMAMERTCDSVVRISPQGSTGSSPSIPSSVSREMRSASIFCRRACFCSSTNRRTFPRAAPFSRAAISRTEKSTSRNPSSSFASINCETR